MRVAIGADHAGLDLKEYLKGKMAEAGVKDGIVAGIHAADARGRELGKLLGAA